MARPPADLDDIINAIEESHEESSAYLDLKTGEVIVLTDEDMRAAEAEDGLDDAPEWQKGVIELAAKVIADETGRYLPLPGSFDADEWHLMEQFALSVKAEPARSALETALQGTGAFRRFKDAVQQHNLAKAWHEARHAAYRDLAIDWCQVNGVEFRE